MPLYQLVVLKAYLLVKNWIFYQKLLKVAILLSKSQMVNFCGNLLLLQKKFQQKKIQKKSINFTEKSKMLKILMILLIILMTIAIITKIAKKKIMLRLLLLI